MQTISLATARKIALGAQGFGAPRPTGRVDRRHVRRLFAAVGVIQIDSVNVIVRSQELPVWARLGAHRRDLLAGMVDDNELFEYWGHMASLVPIELHPLLRWRMAQVDAAMGAEAILAHERPDFVEEIYERVRDRGPLSAGEMSEGDRRSSPWWGWSETKLALEYLFWSGRISARRRTNFERVYDISERMLPAAVLALPTPSEDDAKRALLEIGARSIGIGTASDIADYFRIKHSRLLIGDLVGEGALVKVAVEGWREPAYMHRDARIPRRIDAATLLSPFDSVVWARSRNERLFKFHYRIEIYTPAAKRVYGYYVLPFLLGDRIVARVDVKADRHAGALMAHGAFAEEDVDPTGIAEPLARELHALAAWLELDRVVVGPRGDVSKALARAVAGRSTASATRP